ncbi:MAG: DUF1016 N-terminal domain-containing protein [Limnohabitans sp.]|nr:DUF1016 N-terminal domain-containing protein [Limnohabitans sp.]
MSKLTANTNLYSQISQLLQAARLNVVRAVNATMVTTYYEIGRTIVEDEQQGKQRAEYGKQVLKELSKQLTLEFGKGFSTDNLENMRRFFLTYSISETNSRKLEREPTLNSLPILTTSQSQTNSETSSRKFNLSWSHYIKLMRIENPNERSFYEIECAANN